MLAFLTGYDLLGLSLICATTLLMTVMILVTVNNHIDNR